MKVSFAGNYLLTVPRGSRTDIYTKLLSQEQMQARDARLKGLTNPNQDFVSPLTPINDNSILYTPGQDNIERFNIINSLMEVYPRDNNDILIYETVNNAFAQKAIKIDVSNLKV